MNPSPPESSRARICGIFLVLASLAWLVFAGGRLIRRQSITADESEHLGAGLTYWANRDYALSIGNFFFTQKWATWPIAPSELPTWAQHPRTDRSVARAIGDAYLFAPDRTPQNAAASARWMVFLFCFALAVVVGLVAYEIGGWPAAGFATLLYATTPINLASGVLVTSDTGAALWWVVALFLYDRLLRRASMAAAVFVGFAVALLLLSKFTILHWMMAAAVLAGWRVSRDDRRPKLGRLAAYHGLIVVAAIFVIWLFFGFSFQPGGVALPFPEFSSWSQQLVGKMWQWRLLPEPFLHEFSVVPSMLQPRPAYLFGEFRVGTHWLYFPVAFLAKATVALLSALIVALLVRWRRRSEVALTRSLLTPAVIGLTVLLIAGLFTPLNIGARHVLAVFPLAAIVGGVGLAELVQRGFRAQILAAAIGTVAMVEGLLSSSHPAAWFNALFGGPKSGYRIMVDSSLEWGESIPDLVQWQQRRSPDERSQPIFACVLGPRVFRNYGLEADDLVSAFESGTARTGVFIFSATRLVGGTGACYGQPAGRLEKEWSQRGITSWRQKLATIDAELAASRLAAFCRSQKRAERVGPAYFVYRIGDQDMAKALGP